MDSQSLKAWLLGGSCLRSVRCTGEGKTGSSELSWEKQLKQVQLFMLQKRGLAHKFNYVKRFLQNLKSFIFRKK